MQYRPIPVRESERYRGRRRTPTPSRARFTGVLLTAVLGAAAVAAGATNWLGDAKADSGHVETAEQSALAHERELADQRAARDERDLSSSINATPNELWVLPIRGYHVTSAFGQRPGPLHAGIDLGGIHEGMPVSAVSDGTVILAGWDGGLGKAVHIDHGNGRITVYGHNSQVTVAVGQKVKAGDQIALAGNTGDSFGVHVHLQIRLDGVAVNPIGFFKQRGVDFYLETESVFGTGS